MNPFKKIQVYIKDISCPEKKRKIYYEKYLRKEQ